MLHILASRILQRARLWVVQSPSRQLNVLPRSVRISVYPGKHVRRELKVLTHSVLRNAYRLVANSNFTVGLLRNDWQVTEEKFALMHPGIDVSQFSDLDRDPGARKYTAAGMWFS